jgi:hypothetical protein
MVTLRFTLMSAALLSLAALGLGQDQATPQGVALVRVPERGLQPQVAVDARGVVHLLYYKSDPAAGDLYYARSDDGARFGPPRRVNSQPGSAIAVGNIRGGHLALGRRGRVHVAWNGSQKATPTVPGAKYGSPMLYTRLNDTGTAFEPQRNLIHAAAGLDGGGSVAADGAGNVYVFWHAPEPGKQGQANRRLWVAVSTDDGKTFAAEKTAADEPTGACGCCGMRAFADRQGTVYALYRGAKTEEQRDMFLVTSAGQGFKIDNVHPWHVNFCPMSSEAFAEGPDFVTAAWETNGQVYFARIDPATGKRSAPVAAPGAANERKHPALAVNTRGEVLLAWTEGMGWNRGGRVAWQVFNRDGTPTTVHGRTVGVPVWSLVAAYLRPDGRFAVMY